MPQSKVGASGVSVLRLIRASQPDIVRSTQKDEIYLQHTAEACHDVFHRLAGAFPAMQHARLVQLVGELLYHGLTTGIGLQTLGEEYCNMVQVTGNGRPPALTQRVALVLLRALGPYVSEAAALHLSALHQQQQEAHGGQQEQQEGTHPWGWGHAGDDDEQGSDSGHAGDELLPAGDRSHVARDTGMSFELVSAPSHSHTGTQQGVAHSGVSHSPQHSTEEAREQGSSHSQGSGGGTSSSEPDRGGGGGGGQWQGGSGLSGSRSWVLTAARSAACRLLQAWPWAQGGLLPSGARLHLALFYVFGIYYTLSHRLAGIRYITTARPLAGRTSYRVLGVLLVAQLVVMGVLQAHQAAEVLLPPQVPPLQGSSGGAGIEGGPAWMSGLTRQQRLQVGQARTQHAVLLEDAEEGEEVAKGQGQQQVAGDEGQARGRQPMPAGARSSRPVSGTRSGGDEFEEVLVHRGDLDLDLDLGVEVGPSTSPGEREGDTGAAGQPASSGRRGAMVPARVQPYVSVVSHRQCPLCLSARRYPTSTPCGHVFCWDCVAQWCTEKPECPLCRTRVLLPELVPLVHTTLF